MKQHMIDFPAPFKVTDRSPHTLFGFDIRTYTNAQLLDCIIGSGSASVLASANHSLLDLGRKNMHDLIQLNGIGQGKALMIMATIELSRRRNNEAVRDIICVNTSLEVFNYFSPLISDLPHEEFWLLFLRRNNSVIGSARLSIGGAAGTVVDAKMVFRSALEHRACGIVLCHNHPSGSVKPSSQDVFLTRKLCEGGRNLDIYIGDHVIIGGRNYYSFADDGLIYK
ncbi:MAG: JAB domain-containing protein [Bacteroidota bacterium]|nr:JAB domain-containing protein [Bacteroidota bacterium]